jgi:hypothetical protein
VSPMDHRLMRPRQRSRTLYFIPSGNNLWDSLGNWYLDPNGTRQAAALPTVNDSIVSDGPWVPQWSGTRTVRQAVIDDDNDGQGIDGSLAVRGTATFRGMFEVNMNIIGNAVLAESTRLTGTVLGTATFIDNGCMDGGTATATVPSPPPSC